ncbi:BRO1 domain-containing protein BROX [Ixodes scapularis]|uniref:BRO1 domain-containing protein BROX n=1 Tax=Ixodes scapularis TaxID=6945 RepID=UPI001A9F06B8|nr:BRO1 domain-containing protein BROX [Ixodes scapularis]
MAFWFHRNPLKATAPVNFDLKMLAMDSQALKLCSDLRQARNHLLDLLTDPGNDVGTVETSLNAYLSLFVGLLLAPDEKGGESKLRNSLRFRWTQSMLGNSPLVQSDAVFELVSICQNVGIWHMKRASTVAAKEDINMDEAKDVHKCLRKAAGFFQAMKDKYVGQLREQPVPGSDLDSRVVSAYTNQCTAEAQEVTIGRAIEMKHAPGLISALAHETSKMYTSAADSLAGLEPSKFGRWRKFLILKAVFYLSYAYCYAGENLLAQEKCGEAIRALQESHKCYQDAVQICKQYAGMKGPGTTARLDQHLFFRKLAPLVKRTLDKCERENGFIFHQKVPKDAPELELRATYGLVSPEDFQLPPHDKAWTPVVYAAFYVPPPAGPDPGNSKAAIKAEGDLPAVQEKSVSHSAADPKTSSGCVLQ